MKKNILLLFFVYIVINNNILLAKELPINRMVIEDDNGIIIEDWENYKSIVHLKTDLNDELVNCTGTIISKNIILTAAHCVYNQKLNIKAKSAKIFFRQDNNKFLEYKSINIKIHPEYLTNNNKRYDIGLIKIKNNNTISNEMNNNSYVELIEDLGNRGIQIIGYPADKINESTITLWSDKGIVFSEENGILSYKIDTTSGQSGAPILLENGNVVGIHTSGNKKINYGVHITKDILKWIVENY